MENYKSKKKKKRRMLGTMPSIKNNCGGKRKKKSCAYDVLTLPYMQN